MIRRHRSRKSLQNTDLKRVWRNSRTCIRQFLFRRQGFLCCRQRQSSAIRKQAVEHKDPNTIEGQEGEIFADENMMTCQNCGRRFRAPSAKFRYCPECRILVRKQKVRKNVARIREKNRGICNH